MILQERGDLNVEDALENYLSDIPEAWKGITLHHLLTHTSGIMHSWALPGSIKTMAVRVTPQETIDRFRDQPLIFETGQGYHYSGVAYSVLAQVIGKVSGKSYAEFLREAVLDPAGMQDTGPDRYDVLLPDRAAGYTPTDEGLVNAAPIFMPILTGGGNLYSTVGDLCRFDRALTGGEFISEESYKQMYTTVRQNYGYGWRVVNWSGYRGIMHGGGVSGFNAFLLRFPEQQVCVVVLSNVNPTPMRDISNRLAAIVFEEPALANPLWPGGSAR